MDSPQNLAVGLDCGPQDPQNNPVAVSPPPPPRLGSQSVSFLCWSTMSAVSPCHLRQEVLRPSYVVYFETSQAADHDEASRAVEPPDHRPRLAGDHVAFIRSGHCEGLKSFTRYARRLQSKIRRAAFSICWGGEHGRSVRVR